MNAPARVPDMMTFIERVPLITVATTIVSAFKNKDTKGLAALMISECVKKEGGLLRRASAGLVPMSQSALDEVESLYNQLGGAYGRLALGAGLSPIDTIAFRTGFQPSMQVVENFPPRFFDDPQFQELFKYAESLLVKYTGSPNPVQKDVDALLSQTQK